MTAVPTTPLFADPSRLLLELARKPALPDLLRLVVDRLAESSRVALARIWLMGRSADCDGCVRFRRNLGAAYWYRAGARPSLACEEAAPALMMHARTIESVGGTARTIDSRFSASCDYFCKDDPHGRPDLSALWEPGRDPTVGNPETLSLQEVSFAVPPR